MTQLERFQSLLDKVTYKPGWRFSVEDSNIVKDDLCIKVFTKITMVVCYETIDAVTGKKTDICSAMNFWDDTLAHMSDADIVKTCIGTAIRNAEMHEFEEWFKFHGFNVHDPHP